MMWNKEKCNIKIPTENGRDFFMIVIDENRSRFRI